MTWTHFGQPANDQHPTESWIVTDFEGWHRAYPTAQEAHDLYFDSRLLTSAEKAEAIAQAIASAREEGRREERERCVKIAKWFADDECWDERGTASLILQQIEDPLYDPAA